MFLTILTDPYKLLTIISVILALLTLSRLYWLLKSHNLVSPSFCATDDSGNAVRHPTFQKLEQTLSQNLIQAVLVKFHEIEHMDAHGNHLLSVSDQRIMSYASLLVQLRKTENSTIEIRDMNSKTC